MKYILFVVMLASALVAAEKGGQHPNPVTRTFYVAGVSRAEDAARITKAVAALPSVTEARDLTATSGYIIVSFDTHKILSHTVAQAIMNQGKFVVTQKFEIPGYQAHADELQKVFARVAEERHVKIEPADAKGRFTLTFLPIQIDPKEPRKNGFNPGNLGHPVRDEPPKGLGLEIINLEAPSVVSPAGKKAQAK